MGIQRGDELLFCLLPQRSYDTGQPPHFQRQLLAPSQAGKPSYRITGTSLDSLVLGEAQRCSLSEAKFFVSAAVYAHEPIMKRLPPGAAEPVGRKKAGLVAARRGGVLRRIQVLAWEKEDGTMRQY